MATEVTNTAKLEIQGLDEVPGNPKKTRAKAEPGSFAALITVMKRIQNALESLPLDDQVTVLNFFANRNRIAPPF